MWRPGSRHDAQLGAVINVDVTQEPSSTFTVSVALVAVSIKVGAESGQRKGDAAGSPVSRTNRAGQWNGQVDTSPLRATSRWVPPLMATLQLQVERRGEDSRRRRAGRVDRDGGIWWRPGQRLPSPSSQPYVAVARAVAKAALSHLSSTKSRARRRCACGLL